MKKTITLTAKAVVIAGVIVTFSAQSASAHSEIPKSDKGRSCWAHSRHKEHKHSVGHSHGDCGKTPTTSTSVPANTAQDPIITVGDTTSAPSASSASTPTTGGGDFVLDPTPVADAPASTPATTETSSASPVASAPSETVSSPAAPSTPARDNAPAVVSQPSSDGAAPSPRSTASDSEKAQVAMPSTGAGSVSMMQPIDGDGTQPTSIGSVDGAGSGSAFSWWWLLILLAVAAESYRRYRRARQNREAGVEGIAIA